MSSIAQHMQTSISMCAFGICAEVSPVSEKRTSHNSDTTLAGKSAAKRHAIQRKE